MDVTFAHYTIPEFLSHDRIKSTSVSDFAVFQDRLVDECLATCFRVALSAEPVPR